MEYYRQYHSLLFSIAYRMLGSLQDAEDIVQELFADLQEKDISQIDHIQAYLTKSITNRCINELQSARKKRAGCGFYGSSLHISLEYLFSFF